MHAEINTSVSCLFYAPPMGFMKTTERQMSHQERFPNPLFRFVKYAGHVYMFCSARRVSPLKSTYKTNEPRLPSTRWPPPCLLQLHRSGTEWGSLLLESQQEREAHLVRVGRHAGDPLDPEVERGQGVARLGHEADEEPPQARVHVQGQLVAQGQLGREPGVGRGGKRV